MGSTDAYYYDDKGSQVPLEPADEIAVDLRAAGAADLSAGVIDRLKSNGRALRGDVVMVDSKEVPDADAAALDAVGALQPVFGGSESGGKVVVLPEVRIETDTQEQAREVRSHLESSDVDLEFVRDTDDRMVIRPTSGRGVDALRIANELEEALHPPLAQARFLRIVPRP